MCELLQKTYIETELSQESETRRFPKRMFSVQQSATLLLDDNRYTNVDTQKGKSRCKPHKNERAAARDYVTLITF